jgi:hypothetical protein
VNDSNPALTPIEWAVLTIVRDNIVKSDTASTLATIQRLMGLGLIKIVGATLKLTEKGQMALRTQHPDDL